VGIPTDVNTTKEQCFLRGACQDVISRGSLEFSQLSGDSEELVGE
jgi:hypothetical protein